jgi:predicted YcjX-like family ATPase
VKGLSRQGKTFTTSLVHQQFRTATVEDIVFNKEVKNTRINQE